jgi:hypothetical protein
MQTDWVDWLPIAEFAYNNREHSATGHSPFYLKYSHHPFVPMAPWKVLINNPSAEDFANSLSWARQYAYDTLHDATTLMKWFADWKRREVPLYAVGQEVWLDAQNLKTECPTRKLSLWWLSPFKILGPVPQDAHYPSTYRLALLPSWKIHPVFHVSLLWPALLNTDLHPAAIDNNWLLPDIINGEEEYEVEVILDHQGGKHHHQYLVKWWGYPPLDATWEPKYSLCHAPNIVLHYEDLLEG